MLNLEQMKTLVRAQSLLLEQADRDRDAALAAMWGMICYATELRRSLGHACVDAAKELDVVRAELRRIQGALGPHYGK